MTQTLSAIPLKTITGVDTSLSDHGGKVLLLVNVASKCGLTPQYEGLEALHERLADKGFSVLGFPANDFGAQEPGSNEEIADFCRTNFSVSFPMHEKLVVTGPDKHPLYAALIEAQPKGDTDGAPFRERLRGYGMTPTEEPELLWNFEKFLISRDGKVVGRFAPMTEPDDPALVAAIDAQL
jgi:glutathione peroxidase